MGAVSVTIVNPKDVTLNWSEITSAQNGGDPAIFYIVEYSTN